MTRRGISSLMAGTAAALFFGTAALHGSAYREIRRLAEEAPAGMRELVPALWLSFSLDLCVIALILAVVAWRRPRGAAAILAAASLCPLGVAMLQIRFLGFIPPTALLLGVGALALAASGVSVASDRSSRERPDRPARDPGDGPGTP